MKKLELFGDSILKGVTFSSEHKKYKLCKFAYDTLLEYGVEYDNHSRMGYTVDKGLEILLESCVDLNQNSICVIEFGGNDCNFDWAAVSANPTGEFEPFTTEDVFLEKFRLAVTAAKNTGATVAIATLVPLDPVKYMNWISRGLNRDNILSWLGDENMLARWQEHYNALALRIAVETGTPVIDIRGEFLKNRNYDKLLCEDGIHPTQKGYDIVGAQIIKYVMQNNIMFQKRRTG